MRINKYLAVKQYCTRREADEIIKKGKVFINGKLAKLGDKVSETDVVDVKFRAKKISLLRLPQGARHHHAFAAGR